MAVMWSSLLIILLYYFRKKYLSMSFFSISGLLLLYIFCVIRIVLPIELPFTRVIGLERVYNSLIGFLHLTVWNSGFEIKVKGLLVGIWVIVAFVLLIRLAYHYIISFQEINKYDISTTHDYKDFLTKIALENGKKETYSNPIILTSPSIISPVSFGLFKRFIVLPDKQYSDQEMHYILRHEYAHILNGDLAVKLMVHFMCCIYWWNPIVYLLRVDLEQTLEIKCDLTVTRHLNSEQRADYLQTIVSVMKNSKITKQNNKDILIGSIGLCNTAHIDIMERFKLVAEQKIHSKKFGLLMLIPFSVALLLSYTIVLQSRFEAPQNEVYTDSKTHEVEAYDTYIKKDNAGVYHLIIQGKESSIINEETALMMQEDGFIIIIEGD